MAKTIKPERLKKGDKVGLVSLSKSIKPKKEEFEKAINNFEKRFDLEIVLGDHVFGEHYYSASEPQKRLDDFNKMWFDPSIKAVIETVGGDSAIDLVDKIDYERIRKNPKIFIGISDANTLMNPITYKTGLVTFSGVEFGDFAGKDMVYTSGELEKVLFQAAPIEFEENKNWADFKGLKKEYGGWETIRPGSASGKLFGSNFGSFYQLLGTEYFEVPKNSLLVLEFYKLNKSSIDRFMTSLRLKGVFENINGLILGHNFGSDDSSVEGNERELRDIALKATEGYNFPIMQVGEIGHYIENMILPLGIRATMDATNLKLSTEESAVL